MDMLKKLKRQTLLRMLFPIVLLAVVGIAFLAGSNLFAKEPTPQNLYEVPREELKGSYVTVDVEWIYGCYAYTEETRDNIPTGKITQREYLIDANLDDYMSLIVSGSTMKQAEALLDECDDYYMGLTDEITQGFTVTGYVKSLPSDSLELYHEVLGYDDLTASEQEIVLPLYLSPADFSVNYVILIAGIAFLGVAIVLLVMVLSGRYQRQLKEKLQQLFGGNTEKENEFLNHMLRDVPEYAGMRMEKGYLLLRQGSSHFLYDSSDLIWAYQQTTRQKLYGIITIGKSYSLMLKLADGSARAIGMSQAKVKEQLEKLAVQFPTCVIGYSDQLASVYSQNRDSMRQIAAAQRGNTPQQ